MGLKECREKFGSAITDEQNAALDTALASGKTDEQAVRIAMLIAHQNVVDIAGRVKEETGVDLKVPANPVSDLAEFQIRAMREIDGQRKAIRDEFKEQAKHSENIADLETHFQELVGEDLAAGGKSYYKDLSDDRVLMEAILDFQWTHRAELKAGGAIMGLSGKDQFELFDNYRKMESYKDEIAENFKKGTKELAVLQKRRKAIVAGKGQGDQTLYQSGLGLTSGLLTAAQVMPFTKTMKNGVEVGTDSSQVIATLMKQPNVTEEEMEFIGVPQWAEAMGKITQDQLIEFISAGGLQIKETWYVGTDDPPVTVGNSAWDQVDVPMDWYDDETGQPQDGVIAFEPRILNWNEHPTYLVIFDTEAGNVHVLNEDTGEYLNVGGEMNSQHLAHAEEAIDADLVRAHGKVNDHPEGAEVAGQAKWTEYTLGHDVNNKPQGTNHREVTVSAPSLGGYTYAQEDLHETTYPPEINDSREKEYRENEKYWFIDASSPLADNMPSRPEERNRRRVQTFQIPKDAFNTIEKAKQYIIDEKAIPPGSRDNFTSHAYSQDNIIVWYRMSDRISPSGKLMLVVEEVQSDLHQAGLTQGYRYTQEQKDRSTEKRQAVEMKAAYMMEKFDRPFFGFETVGEALRVYRRDLEDPPTNPAFKDPFEGMSKKQRALMNNAVAAYKKDAKIQAGGPTPNMPFKGDAWAELAMKRVIRLAAEGGYDQVAWPTGVQQMEHYNLSDHFSKVEYDPRDEMLTVYDLNGRLVSNEHYEVSDLAGVVGAEPAMEIQKKIDEAEKRWQVVILQQRGSYNLTIDQIEAGASTQTVDPQDGFIGADEQVWLSENGEVYGLMDENGEMLHQSTGDYHLAETLDGIDVIKQDMMYEGNLPTLTDLTIDDEETHSLKTRYDKLMVNVTNRVARKLDKSAKVKRFGGRITGEGIEPKTNFWRIKNEEGRVLTYDSEAAAKNAQKIGRAQGNSFEVLAPTTFEKGAVVHAIDITPQMKQMALEGQTYFQSIQDQTEAEVLSSTEAQRYVNQQRQAGLLSKSDADKLDAELEAIDGKRAPERTEKERSRLRTIAVGLLDERTNRVPVGVKRQEDTEAFKKFMHRSVVRNEDGSPQVVYHGSQTTEPFDEFSPQGSFGGWNHMGTWFSSEPEHAEIMATTNAFAETGAETGQIIPAYLSIKNPLETTWDELGTIIQEVLEAASIDARSKDAGPEIRAYFQDQGYDGVILRKWEGDGKPAQDVFVALESNQIKSSIGNKGTFDSDSPNIMMQDENRASITFQRANGAIIRMKDSRDFSSFAHEGAHLYLEIMADLAELPDASERLVNDYAKALKYLGVENRFEVTGEHHELWARSWEAYLWEGKSPTAELAPLFSVYSGWMRTVYQKITNLLQPGEELNEEIRGVFDRMMATDEQIKNSEDFMGYVALYSSAEEMGVSDRAFQLYREHMDQAHNESVDHETQKMLRSMLWAKKKWWKDELAKIEDEVRAEAEADPVYKALHLLQRGKNPDGTESDLTPFKLSKESLLELLQNSQATLNKLPGRGKYGIYSAKGGVHVDVAANILGYDSGAKLIDALMNAPHMEEFIRDEAKNRMTALHPDPLTDPELMDEITQAVHNEKRGKILAAELKALRKQEKEHAKAVKVALKDKDENEKKAIAANAAQMPKRVDYAHIKAAAKEVIEGLRYRDINPNTYLQAERRAGRLAFDAMKKKDYGTAYAQKRTQIMQYEAYRAAIRAKAKMESNQKYLRGMEKTAKRKRMGKGGVLEQIDAILEGINFKRIPNKRLDQTPVLRELLPALRKQVEEGTMVIPEDVLKSMETPDGVNWREMTVKEFQGITDIVRQLESQADHTHKMLVNGEYVIIKDAAAKLAASIKSNNAVVEPIAGTKTFWEGVGEGLDSIGGSLANIGHIAKLLDGLDDFGTFNRMIVIPMRRAVSEKLMPWQAKATSDIKRLYMNHYDRWEMQLFGRKNFAKMGGRNISKGEALSIALNQGSATNKAAFFGGKKINGKPAFSPEDTEAVLALLDERDWNFVQAMWDYRQSYWSQLQETQKQRRGISSEQVEPEPFTRTSSDGVEMNMRGGYYHLSYDPDQSKKKKGKGKGHDDYFSGITAGKHVSGSTRAGATYNRVDNHEEVVQLGLHVFENEIREIIRDMAIGSEVNYVDAMLNDEGVREQIMGTGNGHHLKTLEVWIKDVAVGELPAGHVLDRIVSMARTNFTMSKLMLNFRVGLLQFAGASQTAAIVGKVATAKGAVRYASNPAAATRLAFGKSANLAARYGKDSRAFDMAVSDATERLSHGHGGLPTYTKLAAEVYQAVGFAPIYMAQGVTDVITWISAYEKGLSKKNLSDADAVVYADAQVQIAQTSGLWMDRSAFERGSTSEGSRQNRFMRLWATLISFMVSRTVNVYLESKIVKKDVNLSSIVNYLANISLLLVVDAVLVSALYQKFDEDDEPEDMLLQVALESGLGLVGGIPGVRDIESAVYNSGNTAIGSAINSSAHIIIQTANTDFDRKFWKSSIDLFGILTGAPSGAINRTVDVAMSDDPEALEFLFGKDKKE